MVQVEKQAHSPSNTALFISRDISLLEFQRRVLEQARDKKTPLLERVKFLAIFGSNMDEFFMLRISGLHRRVASNGSQSSSQAESLQQELAAIRTLARDLYAAALPCLHQEILPRLEKSGIHLLEYSRLTKHQKERAYKYFKKTVYPLLIPLPLGQGHSFPHISNLYLNLAVVLQDRKGAVRLMRLQVPDTLPRLFPVKRSTGHSGKNGKTSSSVSFLWLEQIITANLEDVFPEEKVVAVRPFRIIRDAGLRVDDLESYDPLDNIDESIQQLNIQRREFGAVMQVAICDDMPVDIRDLLSGILRVDPQDFYVKGNPLGLRSLWELYNDVDRDDLKYRPYKPAVPKSLKRISRPREFFDVIRQEEILLHHPYDSFAPVVDFLSFAARDPKVLSIQQTLYRVGQDSPVVKALMEGAVRGKQVTAVIELKATFDEESNVGWAHLLEQSGVNVVHGLPGLKTHCKLALVTRQEKDGVRRYLHLGTGNYNALTSRMYEDLGMFTGDDVLAEDAGTLMTFLTGESGSQAYQKMLVAPFNLRRRLKELIEREIGHRRAGLPARLIFKVNSLTDMEMIKLLYRASQAGVQVDLFVRGMCCLRPGVEGVSEHISVTSIVGRYLEHSRIYYFFNGGREEVYLGSADLMERNLDRRVELLFPLENPGHVRHICEEILDVYLRDNQLAYAMQPDGKYVRKTPGPGERPVNVQSWLMHARQKS
ncbi:MAG: polyphosphate kinase 1 [Bacteroidota bacterium]